MKRVKKFSFNLKSAMVLLFLFCTASLSAQISGNYTINQNLTASATIYQSFMAVVDDLSGLSRSDGGPSNNTGLGVTGAATFRVAIGSGPYTWANTDQLVIPAIGTTSSVRTITFKGNNEIINYTGSSTERAAIKLTGADWFRFDSIELYSLETTEAWGIQFKNNSNNNIIRNCIIRCPNVTTETSSANSVSAGILFSENDNNLNAGTWGANSFGSNGNDNQILNNSIGGQNDGTSAGTGPAYGIFLCGDASASGCNGNVVRGNLISNYFYRGIMYGFSEENIIDKNTLTNPDVTEQESWGAAAIYYEAQDAGNSGNMYITKNRIFNNAGSGTIPTIAYGIYINEFGSGRMEVSNNAIYNMRATSSVAGQYLYNWGGGAAGDFVSVHNTFSYDDNTDVSNPNVYAIQNYNDGGLTEFSNNIISITRTSSSTTLARYGIYDLNWGTGTFDYNDVFVNRNGTGAQASGDYYGYDGNTNISTLTAWRALGRGNSSFGLNPTFVNLATGDLRPISFPINNGGTNLGYTQDINDSARTVASPDMGAFEVRIDASTTVFTYSANGTSVCGNYTEPVTITVRNENNFPIRNVPVSYQINTSTPVVENIAGPIAANSTIVYTFVSVPRFNSPGLNSISAGVGVVDDNPANSRLTRTFTVIRTPTGSNLSFIGTQGIHNFGGFDVTVPTQPLVYSFTPPIGLTNAQYGTAPANRWNITSNVRTENAGIIVTGSSVTVPSGATNAQVSFNPPSSAIDSFVILNVVFTDPFTGCDTTIRKRIFVAPRCNPNFDFPTTICEGSGVLFDNFSTVSTGNILYKWDFGTGNIEDSATSTNPVFTFPGSGNYTVKFSCITSPYGYVDTLAKILTVTAIPLVDFSRVNACEGIPVALTNTTNPADATYIWTLGDGSPNQVTTNVSKFYTLPGGYAVTLRAEKNGCAGSKTKNVYQFAKPIANGTLASGACDNDDFGFSNSSTITSGNMGYLWNFDEPNAISTEPNPLHKFSTAGTKNVRLTAVSEFGCADSLNTPIVVNIKAAPKASFTADQACGQTPTLFTNNSITPNGIPTSTWTIENVTDINNNATRSHIWSDLGNQSVTLSVTSSNGCTDIISKNLNVLIQPIADFSVADVCQGQQAVFTNKTTSPTGEISYNWNFGDANVSADGAPIHTYNAVGQRNVTLIASILGGCSSTKIIPIEIRESPQACDFDYIKDYAKGLGVHTLTPKGGSLAGTSFKWIYSVGGSNISVAAGVSNVVFPINSTPVSITMIATKNGCECRITKTTDKTLSADAININADVNVYPNPANGIVNIEVNNNTAPLVIEIYNALGAKIADVAATELNGTFSYNFDAHPAGLYLVKLTSGNQTSTVKVTLTK